MFGLRRSARIETERLTLRLPGHDDWRAWAALREDSASFLRPWEPVWSTALPLMLIRRADRRLIGAITLDNIRRGPAQAGTLGYWIGAPFARQGYMGETIRAVVHHAFTRLDLSRIDAACLPENAASRGVLESCGFKYEGVAQAYLQINGRWRNHVLYAALRADRRGRTEVGPA
jgi:ribosomal-protein-alanine N-acetyltransferase